MDSTSIEENFVEESEELMVVLSENNSRPIIRKAHFLNPRVTTIDGSEPLLPPFPSPHSKALSLCVYFRGWKLPNKKFKSWATKMAALHKPTWLKSGIFEAIEASTYRIHKNQSLILSLAQKWCPQTKSFVFPWGEATITLEDVNVLLGFSVSGLSIFAALESSEMEEDIEKLEKRRQKSTREVPWISSFVDDDEMEHEAFLVLWLSKFVFPNMSGHSILRLVFPIAIRLARGERVALAPPLLATLYRDLGALASTQLLYLKSSLFKLVQVWIWERFKNIRPKPTEIPSGKPRIAQWSDLKQRLLDNVGLFLLDDFEWRPYTKPLKNWNPPRFYIEEAKWITIGESLSNDDEFVSLARCMRVSQLVGIGFVENYYPNRVAMQFGLDQDLPGFTTNCSNNYSEKEAWDHYNMSQDGIKLYVPSRFAKSSVTARYRAWWMKSVSEIWREPIETFNASNTIDHYDDSDDDVSAKILPLSQVLEKCGDGVKEYESFTCQRTKRARAMDGYQSTQNGEDDDDMTIAQLIKSRDKCCNVENTKGGEAYEPPGERSRLEVNNKNVSGFHQKLAYEDDENAMNCCKTQDDDDDDDDDDITIAQMIKSRKNGVDAGERRRIEDKEVSDIPQKLAYGDKTVAPTEIEKRTCSDPINGVAEKEEEEVYVIDERLKQRKLAIWELTLKIEARMSMVENTWTKIKQWKIRRNHTKTPASN